MKNGNKSLIWKGKLRSILKLERNARNITEIEESQKKKLEIRVLNDHLF